MGCDTRASAQVPPKSRQRRKRTSCELQQLLFEAVPILFIVAEKILIYVTWTYPRPGREPLWVPSDPEHVSQRTEGRFCKSWYVPSPGTGVKSGPQTPAAQGGSFVETPALTSPPAFYAGAESQGTVYGSCVLLNCCPHGASRPQMGGAVSIRPETLGSSLFTPLRVGPVGTWLTG